MWRRSLQILFHLLSLLLFTATLFLWLRSYWRNDAIETARLWSAESTLGSISVTYGNKNVFSTGYFWTTQTITPTWTALRERGFWFHYRAVEDELALHRLRGSRDETLHFMRVYKTLTLPYWAPALLFAALPALWLIQHRRRPTPGLCPKCRYDLRAHTPGQRCPECGTLIESLPLPGYDIH